MTLPVAKTNFVNPTPTTPKNSPEVPLSGAITKLNTAVSGIETVIGVGGSADPASIEYRLTTLGASVAAHAAAGDPHPAYTTTAEATTVAENALAAHTGAGDPHPAYTTDAEATAIAASALATHTAAADPHPAYATDAEATAIAASAVTTHAAAANPHPVYTTDAEATTIATTAVATHAAAADPHPGYTTPAEVATLAPAETTATIGSLIAGAAAKASPADADSVALSDSASGNILRRLSISALRTAVGSGGSGSAATAETIGALVAGAAEKSTPAPADKIGIADSASGNILRGLTWSALLAALKNLFATLSGAAGGQTLIGGTGAAEALTLQSTGSSTRGKINFGSSAYDESTNRLGVGTSVPTARLHLAAGTSGVGGAPLKMTSGGFLTAPESGAIEYDGGAAYLTTDALARRRLASEDFVRSRGAALLTNGFGTLRDNTNFSGYTFDPVEGYFRGGSFLATGSSVALESDEYIPVDPTKRYVLTLYARSGRGSTNYDAANRQSIGVALYDIDKNPVSSEHADKALSGAADTTLAATLNPGDTTVTLTSASGWQNAGTPESRQFVWYGYADSTGYVYPAYTYTRFGSYAYSGNAAAGTWDAGGITGNVISLRAPWAGPALAAGTAVRNSPAGSHVRYVALSNLPVTNAWTRIEGLIGTLQSGGVASTVQFREGTVYLRLAHMANSAGSPSNEIRLSAVGITDFTYGNLESRIGIGAQYKTYYSALPANGLAVEGSLGVGTYTPTGKLNVVATTEQARLGYSAAAYVSITVASTGVPTLYSTGGAWQIQGDLRVDKTITASGTTGAQTINKTSGSVNFAAGAASVVVTNSLVTASSVVIATVATNDATLKSVAAVAASGSFTLTGNAAATAETRVNFIITN